MTNPMQVNELMADLAGRTAETFSLWADANQRILRELVDLSASTAREGVRLYAEIQSSTLEAVKEGQAYMLSRQDAIQDAPRDPFGALQKGAVATVESAQRTLRADPEPLRGAAAGHRRARRPGDPGHLHPARRQGAVALHPARLN
jgi:hypothetical protein